MAAFIVPSLLFGQVTKECFKARVLTPVKEVMNVQLTSSDTIPLNNLGTIYALSIDAVIEQPREASFVRIVLEDVEGKNYLVAESDRFRNDTTTVNLMEYCEETAQLNGITPLRLKCYLTNAALQLNGIHTSTETPTRGMATEQELRTMKEAQVQSIVDRINAYNNKNHKLWQAGITDWSLQSYADEKDFADEVDAYIGNLKYYYDGFYEFGESVRTYQAEYSSPYVPNYDWRNRHGRSWVTPIKNQDPSGLCTAFAAVAVAESATELYFNRNLNIDLSEYAVGYYSGVSYYFGIYQDLKHYPLQYIRDYGAIDELTMPFLTTPFTNMPEPCPTGNECIRIDDYLTVPANINYVDSIKRMLIHRGPGQSGLHNLNHNHAMALVGYGEIMPDTIYHFIYKYNKDTIFSSYSPMIGKDFWIFKNSYGTNNGHNGYVYYIFNDYQYMHEVFFVKTPVYSLQYDTSDILCEDRDGDGLFNWGIGPKPNYSPAWAPDDADGDDSNPSLGRMDEFGFCEDLGPGHPVYEYIENDSTLTSAHQRTSYLGILRGATVTFQSQQTFISDSKLLLDNGATLILDGTCLDGSCLQPYAGSTIILNNGASISMPFEVPPGVELIINNGSIE